MHSAVGFAAGEEDELSSFDVRTFVKEIILVSYGGSPLSYSPPFTGTLLWCIVWVDCGDRVCVGSLPS